MEHNSIVIINNNSELQGLISLFEKLPKFKNQNLIIIDRREINTINPENILEVKNILLNFKSSQKWLKFMFSAKKASISILKKFKLKEVYFFSNYDPLISFLSNSKLKLNFNLIAQNPGMEKKFTKKNKSIKGIIKSLLKSISLSILQLSPNLVFYINTMSNVKIRKKLKNIIRLYPYPNNSSFNFGKIYREVPNNKNIVYVASDYSNLPEVSYSDFLQDTINFLKKYSISNLCFHPRDSLKFKEDIKKALPKLNYFETYISFKKKNKIDDFFIITIASTVGFDELFQGYSVAFVPQLFKSLNGSSTIKSFKEYLKIATS